MAMGSAVPVEAWEQRQVVSWWHETYPEHKIIMIRNDGSRTPREKINQMRMGLCPGAADLYIPYKHLWIEMKRVKGSVVSDNQSRFRDYVQDICRDRYELCYGHEQAKDIINNAMNRYSV